MQTHLEPLAETGAGELVEAAEIEAAAVRAAGGPLRELRLMRTEKGVVAFLTLGLDPASTLAEAHSWASEVEETAAPRSTRRRRRDRAHGTLGEAVHVHSGGVRARAWLAGRIDGDVVVQLAARHFQSFFTGGSAARETLGTRSATCSSGHLCWNRPPSGC